MKTVRLACISALFPLFLPLIPTAVRAAQTSIKVVRVTAAPPAPAKAGPPDFSGEPLVVQHDATLYHYNADGTGERTVRVSVRVQSEAAVRAYGLLSFAYAADNESIAIPYVRVHKPDGTTVATNLGALHDMPAEVTREAPLYSDQRQVQVPVQSLAVGDTLEYEAVVQMKKAEAPGQFWGALYFDSNVVSLDEQMELRFPASRTVTVLSPGAKPTIRTENGDRVYDWHNLQLKPTVKSGSDQSTGDSVQKLVPDVGWTTFQNWAAVGTWYRDLAAGRAEPDAAIRTKAASLTAAAMTEQEKIDQIFRFVSMQIRYIGVDFGVGRYQPHTAAEVLAAGYGDCKDKHTLLSALLSAEGIAASPVLIGAGIQIDKDLPAPNAFNHVITFVDQKNGKRLWLDSTAEVAPPGMLLSTLRGKDALLIPASGTAALLIHTPATLPFSASDHIVAKGTLDKNDVLKGHFDLTLHGDMEYWFRAALFSANRAQWPTVGQTLASALGYGGTVSNFSADNVETPSKPLHLAWDYERDNFGDWANHRIVSLIPTGVFSTDTFDKQPEQAIELGAPRIESAESILTLPSGYTPTKLPEDAHVQSSFASFEIHHALEGQVLTVTETMQVKSATAPATDWQEYNTFGRDLADKNGVFLDLTQADAAPATTSVPSAQPSTNLPAQTLDAGSQVLLGEAFEALRVGDIAKARARLDNARAKDPNQPGIWALAAALAAGQKHWDEAEADLGKEASLHPDEHDRLLPVRLGLDLQQKQNPKLAADAIEVLTALRKLHPEDSALTREEGALLTEQKRNEEAVSLLEGAVLQHPADKQNMLALAQAQFDAGRPSEAQVTLESLLDSTAEPGLLNDAAYALADHNLDLKLAASEATKALTLFADATQKGSIDSLQQVDLNTQQLLAAIWDTVGWIDLLENDAPTAEPLLRAAWMGSERGEVGYHLGKLYEKEDKPQQAFETYILADATLGSSAAVHTEIEARISALKAQGLKTSFQESATTRLAEQRSLTLPLLANEQSEADFLMQAAAGEVQQVKFIGGNAILRSQEKLLLTALNHNHELFAEPPGKARLIRRAILSCSPVIHSCQLILFLPQDARLPNPDEQLASDPVPPPHSEALKH